MRSLPSDLEGNFSIFSDEEVPSFNNRVRKLKRVLKSWISIHKEHTFIPVVNVPINDCGKIKSLIAKHNSTQNTKLITAS